MRGMSLLGLWDSGFTGFGLRGGSQSLTGSGMKGFGFGEVQ